jgi:hypothetical protein
MHTQKKAVGLGRNGQVLTGSHQFTDSIKLFPLNLPANPSGSNSKLLYFFKNLLKLLPPVLPPFVLIYPWPFFSFWPVLGI